MALPIIISSSLSEYSLEIIFTITSVNYQSEMVLKQYFLLFPEFNSISITNNINECVAKSLFVYNRNGTICYYQSNKQNEYINSLGVHKITINKHLINGTYYLGKYIFSFDILPGAKHYNLTVEELRNIFEIDRINKNKNKNISNNNIAITLINNNTKKKYSFMSLGSAVKFLKNATYQANQQILVKSLNTNKSYYGYTCHKAKLF
jgi:hypothetical protein